MLLNVAKLYYWFSCIDYIQATVSVNGTESCWADAPEFKDNHVAQYMIRPCYLQYQFSAYSDDLRFLLSYATKLLLYNEVLNKSRVLTGEKPKTFFVSRAKTTSSCSLPPLTWMTSTVNTRILEYLCFYFMRAPLHRIQVTLLVRYLRLGRLFSPLSSHSSTHTHYTHFQINTHPISGVNGGTLEVV